jgi:uncharacterized repeat protein (TIGR01451 family)
MQRVASVGLSGWRRRQTVVLLAATTVALMVAVVSVSTTAGAQTAQGVDLNVRKSVSPKTVAVGEKQTFTIRVSNQGNHRARGVTMKDPLPGKVKFIRASTSRHVPGSCGLNSKRTVVCHLGTLQAGKRVTVWIVVRTVEAGRYTNRAYVSHDTNTRALDTSADQDAATSRIIGKR